MTSNQGPAYNPDLVADLDRQANEWMQASQKWLDQGALNSDHDAGLLADQVTGLRGLYKKVDEARKDAKKPYDDAGKAVQEAFNPILHRLKACADALKKMAGDYAQKKEAEARAEQARKQAEAEAARKAAEEAQAKAAEGNDIRAKLEAEEAAQRAEEADKAAAQKINANIKSATGAGRTMALRTTKSVEITNPRVLALHYIDRPEILDVLKRLALADVRAADVDETKIPGIEITETKVAA